MPFRKSYALRLLLFTCLLFLPETITGGSLLPPPPPRPVQDAEDQTAQDAADTFQRPERPQLMVQLGHSRAILSVAFSPDGLHVMTGSDDKTARLWDRETGKEVRKFEGHGGAITSIAISSDGREVLTSSRDETARLWDRETGKELRKFEGHRGAIETIAFSPDGRYVLTGSDDKTARLWDRDTGKELRKFEGHADDITSVAFSPCGRFVLTGSWDKTARLWDLEMMGEEVQLFKGHADGIFSVAFSPDGRYVLTGSKDKTARLWGRGTGKELRKFEGHGGAIETIAFSPYESYVLPGNEDKAAHLLDWKTGKEVRKFEGHTGLVVSVSFSPDGRYVLTGSNDKAARLWDRETGLELKRFEAYAATIGCVAFSPDGRYVLTGSADQAARLLDWETGKEMRRFEGHADGIFSIDISPDGRHVVTGSNDNTARLWELETGREVKRFNPRRFETKFAGELAPVNWFFPTVFSTDGHHVLTGSWDGTVVLWDIETGKELRRFEGHALGISSVAFSSDGRHVLTGSNDKTARLWDRETGKEVRKFEGHTGLVVSVAFSPDGRYVLTGSGDDTARLWDRETGEEVRKFKGHTRVLNSAAFSSDGRYVLTGSADKTARLWDRETGKEVRKFEGCHQEGIIPVAFSPEGLHVLTGSWDLTVCLWDRETGKEVRKFIGHAGAISSLAVPLRDRRHLLTGSVDGTARFWNVETKKDLVSLISFREGTWAVVTPEGRFDTNNLEEIQGLHWIMPDDPLRPLPVEVFMRDYYEPRLLPRVLAGEQFKPIRPLAELNRVQPGVKILKVEQGASPDIAKVTVEVSRAQGTFQRGGKDVVMKTGVYDLRLYRNGQLVGQWPEAGELTYKSLNTTSKEELNAWQEATKIPLDKDGKATKTFTVRLPRREDLKEVDFTAYAFNLDRVKSETARPPQPYKVPAGLNTVAGRAYVITVGVSRTEDFLWKLRFASNDAELMQETVGKKLKEGKRYEKVVPVCLITTSPGTVDPEAQAVCGELIRPTKENIKTVLDILAGRKVESVRLELIPQKLRAELRRVEPEDLVMLSFSSHGVTDDKSGEFYVLPYDLGKESAGKVTSGLLKRSISSQELSLWLSTVDAEQLVMVVDACHSAAAVEAEGYKPGPMGNPGLGQLSYDKGMPILVASEASESAWAEGGYSLLTLALAKEGIEEKQMGLGEALKYAEQRVPKLYEEKIGKEEKKKIQEPKLFEFRRPY